jgi:cellulose synthase/poly-beta-1,6-N-acetylglucosamine synthase-like glycosyltransferase
MDQGRTDCTDRPTFSIVIAVCDDWQLLERCLQSLERQVDSPSFEIIVVDDGSTTPAPESVNQGAAACSMTIIRQPHQGIPSARNRGIGTATGEVILFVDSDCCLEAHCLSILHAAITSSPEHDCFQLRLVGNCSTLMGKAEELKLMTFQNHMLQADGRIRYLDTAGFAIRHARVHAATFDPSALRGEDTLLLANLMERGELPLFVASAVVEHARPMSFFECVRKDFRSAYLQSRAYRMMAARGLKMRMTNRERLRLLRDMWKAADQKSIGRSAWFVILMRQMLSRMASVSYEYLGVQNS